MFTGCKTGIYEWKRNWRSARRQWKFTCYIPGIFRGKEHCIFLPDRFPSVIAIKPDIPLIFLYSFLSITRRVIVLFGLFIAKAGQGCRYINKTPGDGHVCTFGMHSSKQDWRWIVQGLCQWNWLMLFVSLYIYIIFFFLIMYCSGVIAPAAYTFSCVKSYFYGEWHGNKWKINIKWL